MYVFWPKYTLSSNFMKILASSIALVFTALILFTCSPSNDNKNSKKVTKKEMKTTQKKEKSKKAKPEPTKKEKKETGATPEQLKKAKEIISSVSKKEIEAIDAKKKFKQFCATCHGFTGDLNVNGAKDLTVSKISLEESVAQVYHGKGLMTPFSGIMNDAEIVAVAKWIEGLRK